MQRFSQLYERLDGTTSTLAKVAAMVDYFRDAPSADAAWAVFLLSGQRFKRLVPTGELRAWALEASGLPSWLFEDCYASVGDLAETLALLVSTDAPAGDDDLALTQWIEQRILPLRQMDEDARRRTVLEWWASHPRRHVFLINKMLTGALRVGVSRRLVCRALGQVADLEPAVLVHRLMGDWQPSAEAYDALVSAEDVGDVISRPYPFYLATQLDLEAEDLGPVGDWLAEWKWDGIRAQLIRRQGESFLWSRGEELIVDRFPEVRDASSQLPDGTVLDGEVLAWRGGEPLPFAVLQRRIGRKKPGRKILQDAPAVFMAYDVMEHGGRDIRQISQVQRRELLESLIEALPEDVSQIFPLSPPVQAATWEDLAQLRAASREQGVEGLMLKRREAPYRSGRPKGDWWKWKVDPLHLDAVMIYAQAGHGRRSNLFTDYTFAVWRGDELVPVAKAYSGLDNQEIRKLDRWIRQNTRERFGPVRSVEPVHVFELAFDGIQRSPRHKSGVALRFPRIARWRQDKTSEQADTLEQVQALLPRQ